MDTVITVKEEAVPSQLVQDFYRCTHCGEDTRQYINGHIKYLKLYQRGSNMAKKGNVQVNTYRERSRKKIGRHKKKDEQT
ncbi:MAG: hypothetical protein CM15mV127_110 [Caudoviricetes sp.]|nr:MAG: hypothetical protein CM15mV127_110 [Caudoviricetes sp.]